MQMMSIASGSSGNCIYIGSEETHILIDAGIAAKRIESGLNDIGLKLEDIHALFVTHEHSDHIAGLGVLSRRHGIPVYTARETITELKKMKTLGAVPPEVYHDVQADEEVQVGDLTVHPFAISHDAARPLAYRVSCGEKSVGVVTDLGYYSDYIVENMKGMQAVLLESNHDINMLQTGPYPYYLNRRIMGDHGHLSNESAGRLLCEVLHDQMKYIMLGHLSKENNYDELAYETVRLEITMGDTPYQGSDFPIAVARRDTPSALLTI